MAEEMERLIPDAGLVVLQGAGHYSYLDQSASFARIVSHFIAPPAQAGSPAHASTEPAGRSADGGAAPAGQRGDAGEPT
jgi:hypothetical protein